MSQWFYVVPVGTFATQVWHTFQCFDMIECQGSDISEVMQGWITLTKNVGFYCPSLKKYIYIYNIYDCKWLII